ncbi:MarR family winged helix-turn-helix transcriptional regulator [Pelagibius sp. Alg239-R121]|uniref:MarR family winged helix-turn-helix transcriptional regulator n=1 Tax=Pelagibius sp. Alg239-R121 TaxID=2993448 RepID=UPI0024A67D1D|nr:MarR family transcriptional regulator [Pelagibius sp. Alg239-R121]
MTKQTRSELRFLIDRIARISASEDWSDGLNPTQRAAISYLARANRFSRMPSQVADYLSATRGTVSQTLKALARKGLVIEVRSESDRRSVSYEVTPEGQNALEVDTLLDAALADLGTKDAANLTTSMKALAKCLLSAREGRSFGICKTCRHHRKGKTGAHCALLEVELLPEETEQLCHEHEAAA